MKDNFFKQKLNDCSNMIIVNDGSTILSLAKSVNLGMGSIMLLPFFGLYCREAQEFYNVRVAETGCTVQDFGER